MWFVATTGVPGLQGQLVSFLPFTGCRSCTLTLSGVRRVKKKRSLPLTISDHFREAGRICRGIFNLCVSVATERKTISRSAVNAEVFFKKGECYRISKCDQGFRPLGFKKYSRVIDLFGMDDFRGLIHENDAVLLIDHKIMDEPAFTTNVVWYVFHLGLQQNMWLVADLDPLE